MNADGWLVNGTPDNTLPYLLADEGYDVFVGNYRGVEEYSSHESYDSSSQEFWDFTFVEQAKFDLPALVSKAIDVSGVYMLSLVASTSGTMKVFTALAQDTNFYDNKINKAVMLGPCTWATFEPSWD